MRNITHKNRNRKTNRNNKKHKRNTLKNMMGGKKRVEKILISFEKQNTNPDIRSKIRVLKGPTYNNKGKGKIGYLVNFIASTANEFEEELSQIVKGLPEMGNKQKKYELIFYDNDA
jgi:hypothetical protein